MEFFVKLGALVAQRWQARRYDEERFPELAHDALVELAPHRHVAYGEIVDWLQSGRAPVAQHDLEARFGEPPITLFMHERFSIDALFWLDGTTAIHEHSFSGAFQVLHGASVHAQYDFDVLDRISARLMRGRTRVRKTELLQAGGTRTIRSGDRFIHSLFHLERPSVTIVVRTFDDRLDRPQFLYLKPNLALDPFVSPPLLFKRLELLRALEKWDRPAYERELIDFVRGSDLETLVRSYRTLAGVDAELRQRLFDAMAPRHAADLMAPLQETVRQVNIIARRDQIWRYEHRFFLAMLLNVDRRASILELVAQRYPERPAAETIVGWLRELSRLPSPHAGEPNLLGLSTGDGDDFGDEALAVVRGLVEGRAPAEIAQQLRAAGDDGFDAEDVAAFTAELAATTLLQPLFG